MTSCRTSATGPGSGVVPLVSMLRHARHVGALDLLRLAVSARSLSVLPYAGELVAAGALVALTRAGGSTGPPSRPVGRLTAADLAPMVRPGSTSYVCGSAPFAEAVSRLIVGLGVDAASVRVERFGPSG